MMVQGTKPVFEVGRSVLVLYGSPLRVIADRTQGWLIRGARGLELVQAPCINAMPRILTALLSAKWVVSPG